MCFDFFPQNCYDIPHLTKVDMPIRVSIAEIKDDCLVQRIPEPKTQCWEEEVMLCPSVPQLIEKQQILLKCTFNLSNDDCSRVKLTIPKEICFPEEKYYPYPGGYSRPYYHKTN